MTDLIRRTHIASLRTMEEHFGRQGGAFSQFIRDDIGRMADRVEYNNEDLETILWEHQHGEKL